jgi:hypothetical protein
MNAPFNRTRPVAEGFAAIAVATPMSLVDVETVVVFSPRLSPIGLTLVRTDAARCPSRL